MFGIKETSMNNKKIPYIIIMVVLVVLLIYYIFEGAYMFVSTGRISASAIYVPLLIVALMAGANALYRLSEVLPMKYIVLIIIVLLSLYSCTISNELRFLTISYTSA